MSNIETGIPPLLSCKIVVVGDAGVGKSTFLSTFSTGRYDPNVTSTIGINFFSRPFPSSIKTDHDATVRLMVWDTAGQERYRSLARSYYRGADAAVIMYDSSDNGKSLNRIDTWLAEVEENVAPPLVGWGMESDGLRSSRNVPFVIVANKIDDENETTKVLLAEGKALARRRGCLFGETSAVTGEGIDRVFAKIVEECERRWYKEVKSREAKTVSVKVGAGKKSAGGGIGGGGGQPMKLKASSEEGEKKSSSSCCA